MWTTNLHFFLRAPSQCQAENFPNDPRNYLPPWCKALETKYKHMTTPPTHLPLTADTNTQSSYDKWLGSKPTYFRIICPSHHTLIGREFYYWFDEWSHFVWTSSGSLIFILSLWDRFCGHASGHEMRLASVWEQLYRIAQRRWLVQMQQQQPAFNLTHANLTTVRSSLPHCNTSHGFLWTISSCCKRGLLDNSSRHSLFKASLN